MKLTPTFQNGRGAARIRPFGATRRTRTRSARMFPVEAERPVTQAELRRLLSA